MQKNAPSYAYSFRERNTKKGIVYDILFRIVNVQGKEVQKALCGYATKTKAKQAFTEFMSTYIAPSKKISTKGRLEFEVLEKQYFVAIKNQVKESTLYDKINIFKLYLEPAFNGRDISTITKQDIYQWQDSLWAMEHCGKPYAHKYLMKIRNYFSAYLQWCAERYGIYNFFDDIKAPKRKAAPREMQIWERAEFEKFIAVVTDPLWRALFMTLYFSGGRIGEIVSLSEADISNKGISINKSLSRKTLDNTPYKITETKNYKNRIVPVPTPLAHELANYLSWKRQNNQASTFMFGGDKPLAENTITRKFNSYIELAGVNRIRIHELRHSYVSLLVHLGANLTVVANLIGDTLEQVVKTYAHMFESDKKLLIDKIIL